MKLISAGRTVFRPRQRGLARGARTKLSSLRKLLLTPFHQGQNNMRSLPASTIATVSCFLLSLVNAVTSTALAETWTPVLKVESITPMSSWFGGLVRVKLSTNIATSNCGTTNEIDFAFSGGTAESRSAVISALYVAFASDRNVKFALSDTSCSVPGQPLFTGVNVAS